MKLMQKNTDSFFSSSNTISFLSEEDLNCRHHYIELLDAIARTTYQSIYIIDYFTKKFEYATENSLFLCGYSAQEFMELGYEFYLKNTPEDELELLLKINKVGFDFYEKIPFEERKRYSISYDFHIVNQFGKKILVNHQYTPLFLTKEGKIWKAICVFSLSNNTCSGNIIIHKEQANRVWKYNMNSQKWIEEEKVSLTDREKEILILSAQGYSIQEISEKLHIAPDTIKFHRKKLFEKIGVTNISEAINFSTKNKLI